MKFLDKLRTNLMIKKSRRKNKDVTYGSELEIYDASIVYTNRYQNYVIPNNELFGEKGLKFLSNIIIQITLNPDTLYCKELFKFLDMLSIGSIRYTFLKQKQTMLLYVSTNVYDLESLLCANIESSNVLIETIVTLLGTLPKDGFSRVITKNIIHESSFAYSNNYNYDELNELKPYKDFQTSVNRYNHMQIVEIIEIDHVEYGMEKYNETSAIRLSNIIFISHLNLNCRGFKFEVAKKDNHSIYVYCMSIDDFIIELETAILFNDRQQGLYANLLSIIFDQNIGNYFNINKDKDGVNIFNITPINMERVNNYRDYMEIDYDDDSEEDESPGEVSDYEYSEFYDNVDEVLSEEEIKEAEKYLEKANSQDRINIKM